MRSTVVIAIAVATASCSAFAAPTHPASADDKSSNDRSDAPAPAGDVPREAFRLGSLLGPVSVKHNERVNTKQARELVNLLERLEAVEGSEALKRSPKNASHVATVGRHVVDSLHNILGGHKRTQQQRDVGLAHSSDESVTTSLLGPSPTAVSFSENKSIARSLKGLSVARQARGLTDILARTVDDSSALSLGTIGTIASLGPSILSGLIDQLGHGGDKQSRDLVGELLAREDDDSQALSLGTIGTVASLGSSVVTSIIDHFKHKNDQQSREFASRLARAFDDDSGAIFLHEISSLGPAIESLTPLGHKSGLHSIALPARAMYQHARSASDESGALVFPVGDDGLPVYRPSLRPGDIALPRRHHTRGKINIGTMRGIHDIGANVARSLNDLD